MHVICVDRLDAYFPALSPQKEVEFDLLLLLTTTANCHRL